MSKAELKKIANNINIDLNEHIEDKLLKEYDEQIRKIKALQKIDTTNVKPMVYIDETPISFLREDVPGEVLDVKNIIDNAPTSEGNFITITKVVK